MRVQLNKAQYDAVNDLRGLPEDAHMLVMCSHHTARGGVLDGSEEAFEQLLSFISEELSYGVSARRARVLYSVAVAIDPDCADWIGM